jgi:hypothetical protein
MPRPVKNAKKAATPSAPPEGDLSVSTVRLRKDQWEALRTEAFRRAQERGSGRPDASEVLREALDAWMKRR